MPEYAAIHSHVLQDVLARLDKTYQAFFRRVQAGQTPGFPRFQGRNRYHSFTYKEFGNGAQLDNGFLVFSKIGRIAVRWSRPLEGTPKTVTISHEADGWYVIFSCADVPDQPLAVDGQETGIDVGLKVFLITADGLMRREPTPLPPGREAAGQGAARVSRRKKGSHRRRKAVQLLAQGSIKRSSASARDFHHKTALPLLADTTTPSISKICRSPTWYRNQSASPRRISRTPAGRSSVPSSTPRQHAPGKRVVAVPPIHQPGL